MKNNSEKARSLLDRARPLLDQHSMEIQPYGTIAKLPIALAESTKELASALYVAD